jgi:sugar/nucleoside kinase (ribokinase family)
MNHHDIVVLGDVNMDCCVTENLQFAFSSLTQNGCIAWHPINERPGGTGLNFAVEAQRFGYCPLLVGRIGNDYAGHCLREYLSNLNLSKGIYVDSFAPTGRSIIVRDLNDVRLLVDNGRNANRSLTEGDVEVYSEEIINAQILYISGYCIKDPEAPRLRAVRKAVDIAMSGNVIIAFDVVPHKIYSTYTLSELHEIIPRIDILISEVATMRRFLGIGCSSEILCEDICAQTLEIIKNKYSRCILRWGQSGLDCELLWDRTKDITIRRSNDHAGESDKRGFGDRVAIDAFTTIFGLAPIMP